MKLSKIASACLLLTVTSIYAQEKKDKVVLDDVIITGGKIEKSLQESVTSVQVFDENNFANSSKLNEMFDLFEQTSNVNRTGKFTFNIRGITTTGITGTYSGPRTINVSVDGVAQGSNASKQGAISTWDVQQVEIIKGPQSTTQGRNSLAGAVVLKTKDPEFDANGAAQINYGSNNNYQLSAVQTGAISENIALRLAVDKVHSDGFVTNDSFRGDKFNEKDINTVRGKVLYKFGDDATALLTLSKVVHDEKGYWQVDENRNSVNNTDGYYDTDAQSHSLELNFPINNNWSLKSLTSYTNETLDRLSDVDNLSGSGFATFDRENKSINQEFRFNYDSDNLKTVLGLYHSQGEGTDDRLIKNFQFTSGVFVDSAQVLKEDYKNTALFFNTDYYLNDKFTIILGARIDKDTRDSSTDLETKRINDLGAATNAVIDAQLAALATGDNTASIDTINFVPKIGFNYKWNDNINTGFIFSQGYRPGGMSTNPISGQTKEYDKEFTNNFELSFKSVWLDKRLIFNTNLFYTKWKEQQVTQQGTTSSTFDVDTVNAGKSTLKGVEFDTKYLITNNLDIYSNLGYVKAQFDEYIDGTNNYSGNSFIKTPKLTANLGLNFRGDDGIFVGGNINYTGSQYADNANKRKISSHTLVNIKAGYEENDWAVYLFANNLFDKEYKVNNLGNGIYEMGDERIVGINFKYYW